MHSAKTRVEDLEERVRRYDAEARKLENDFIRGTMATTATA
jgi:hypothetical protein